MVQGYEVKKAKVYGGDAQPTVITINRREGTLGTWHKRTLLPTAVL